MAEVTATDRANAASLWGWCMDHEGQRSTVELVATALAEEREKARAPFLALADDLARHTVEPETERAQGFIQGLNTAALRITVVAEQS